MALQLTVKSLRETKEKINKWDYVKLKSFLHRKGNQQNEKGTY